LRGDFFLLFSLRRGLYSHCNGDKAASPAGDSFLQRQKGIEKGA